MSTRIKWNRCRKIEPDGVRCPMINWGPSYCGLHQPVKGKVEEVETKDQIQARLDLAMLTVKGINAVTAQGMGIPSTFLDRIIGLETRPQLTRDYKARVILNVFERMPLSLQAYIKEKMAEISNPQPLPVEEVVE